MQGQCTEPVAKEERKDKSRIIGRKLRGGNKGLEEAQGEQLEQERSEGIGERTRTQK